MKKIENYSGDGDIKYLDAPGLLGKSGVMIDFRPFDISTDYKENYSLEGIPKGDLYLLYLVIEDPGLRDDLLAGDCSFELMKDGIIVSKQSSEISNMIIAYSEREIQIYFYKKNMGPAYFEIDDYTAKWTLSVSYRIRSKSDLGNGFFRITTGGTK